MSKFQRGAALNAINVWGLGRKSEDIHSILKPINIQPVIQWGSIPGNHCSGIQSLTWETAVVTRRVVWGWEHCGHHFKLSLSPPVPPQRTPVRITCSFGLIQCLGFLGMSTTGKSVLSCAALLPNRPISTESPLPRPLHCRVQSTSLNGIKMSPDT